MLEYHKDRDNGSTLIAAMDDTHLMNLVNLRCREIHKVMNSSLNIKDPALAAFYQVVVPSAEEAGKKAAGMVRQLYPYLAEALLRGGEVAAVCATAIRSAVGRDASLATEMSFEQLTNLENT